MVFWVQVRLGATWCNSVGIPRNTKSKKFSLWSISRNSLCFYNVDPQILFLVYCTPLTMVLNHYKLNSEPSFSVFPADWIHFSWKMAFGWSWRLLGETRNSNHAILHETSWKPLLVAMCRRKKQVPNVLRWASMSAFMRVSLATHSF